MKKIKSQKNNTKEVMLTESKTMRDEYLKEDFYDIIDKVKAIEYLTNDMVLSVEQVAEYYEVSKKAIETVIKRNRAELEEDGIMVLKGEELVNFKEEVSLLHSEGDIAISPKVPSLTIVTKRAMLRIGMLLTTSAVAKEIRSYLLDSEARMTEEEKKWWVNRQAGIMDRKRMTTAISKYVPDSPNKKWKYPNYTNMVYKVIFGKDAKKMKEERGFNNNDSLRDSFTGEELLMIEEAETIVTALITLGFESAYIKEQLEKKFKKLLNEH